MACWDRLKSVTDEWSATEFDRDGSWVVWAAAVTGARRSRLARADGMSPPNLSAPVPAENSIALKSVKSAREGTNFSVSECERSAPRAEGHRLGACAYIKEEAIAQAARRSYR